MADETVSLELKLANDDVAKAKANLDEFDKKLKDITEKSADLDKATSKTHEVGKAFEGAASKGKEVAESIKGIAEAQGKLGETAASAKDLFESLNSAIEGTKMGAGALGQIFTIGAGVAGGVAIGTQIVSAVSSAYEVIRKAQGFETADEYETRFTKMGKEESEKRAGPYTFDNAVTSTSPYQMRTPQESRSGGFIGSVLGESGLARPMASVMLQNSIEELQKSDETFQKLKGDVNKMTPKWAIQENYSAVEYNQILAKAKELLQERGEALLKEAQKGQDDLVAGALGDDPHSIAMLAFELTRAGYGDVAQRMNDPKARENYGKIIAEQLARHVADVVSGGDDVARMELENELKALPPEKRGEAEARAAVIGRERAEDATIKKEAEVASKQEAEIQKWRDALKEEIIKRYARGETINREWISSKLREFGTEGAAADADIGDLLDASLRGLRDGAWKKAADSAKKNEKRRRAFDPDWQFHDNLASADDPEEYRALVEFEAEKQNKAFEQAQIDYMTAGNPAMKRQLQSDAAWERRFNDPSSAMNMAARQAQIRAMGGEGGSLGHAARVAEQRQDAWERMERASMTFERAIEKLANGDIEIRL